MKCFYLVATQKLKAMEHQNNLQQVWKELSSGKPLEQQFIERAKFIMNKVCLVAGDSKYRIVDCEVYYHSEEHKDPYVHSVVQ